MLDILKGLYRAAREPVLIMKDDKLVHRNNAAMQFEKQLTMPEEFCIQPVPFVGTFLVEETEYQAVASAAGEYRVFVLYKVENSSKNILVSLGGAIKDSITAIRLAANALNKDIEDERSRFYRNMMEHQISSIDRLAGNMLYVGGNKGYGSNESIDIVKLYGELIHSVNTLTNGNRATVSFAPAVSELSVIGDCNLLERMILNLLSNSLKATTAKDNVVVTVERRGNRAMITVNDTGKGISEDILPHLFSSYNVERSLSESYHSIGMGLSIVQGIARSMGGMVMVKSEEGKGTMVTVSLPLNEQNVFFSPSEKYGAKSMRILQTELCEVLTADCYGEMFND